MKRGMGSVSSRGGAAWSREGADYRKRQEDAVLKRGPEGQHGRVIPHSVEALRRAIEAQVCPWCGSGPFKVLAAHTHKAHGVSAAELRRQADYNQAASVCSPTASAGARDRWLTRPDREDTTARALAASRKVDAQKKATAAWLSRHRDDTRERDQRILELYQENFLLQQIADDVGLHARHVKAVLRRSGLLQDGRAARFRNSDFQTMAARGRQQAAATWSLRMDDLRAARVAEYRALGASWHAIETLAQRWHVSEKAARAYLRRAGVDLPDGRLCSPQRGGPRPWQRKDPVPCAESGCERHAVCRGMCRMHYQRWSRSKEVGSA